MNQQLCDFQAENVLQSNSACTNCGRVKSCLDWRIAKMDFFLHFHTGKL